MGDPGTAAQVPDPVLPILLRPPRAGIMKAFVITIVVAIALLLGLVGFVSSVPGQSAKGALPPLSSEEETLVKKLAEHVALLARDIGRRTPSDGARVARTLEYIEEQLARTGMTITQETLQSGNRSGILLIAQQAGARSGGEIVLVGSHYDTARNSPGADCNASGTAACIEPAKRFAGVAHDRTLRFVFFSLSEPPYSGTDNQGAAQYARACIDKKEKVVSALVVEGLGSWN